MIDVSLGVRTAFFQALNGSLTFNGNPVPIGDDMKPVGSTAPMWVILASQTSVPRNTGNAWATDETIDLDIVFKTSTTTGKKSLDLVANEILGIIFPNPPGTIGIPAQPGMQFLNLMVSANRYISLALNSSNSVERRIITIKLYVAQT